MGSEDQLSEEKGPILDTMGSMVSEIGEHGVNIVDPGFDVGGPQELNLTTSDHETMHHQGHADVFEDQKRKSTIRSTRRNNEDDDYDGYDDYEWNGFRRKYGTRRVPRRSDYRNSFKRDQFSHRNDEHEVSYNAKCIIDSRYLLWVDKLFNKYTH